MTDPAILLGLEIEQSTDERWSGYTDHISGDNVRQLEEDGFEVTIEPVVRYQPEVEANLRVVIERGEQDD